MFLIFPVTVLAYAVDSTGEFGDSERSGEQPSEFLVPAASADTLPTSGYQIGPLDVLEIEVFRVEDLSRTVRVNNEGHISLPLVGKVNAKGKTVSELEEEITARLGEYMQAPHVTVFISEYESQKVTVNGWVTRPGVFPLKGKTSLIQALSMAGGIKRLGDPTEMVIFREKQGEGTIGYKINFEDVQAGKVPDPVLLSNDIIVVPENGSKAAFEETTKTLRTFLGFTLFF